MATKSPKSPHQHHRWAWTLAELQDLLDEWLLAGWQIRPHDALRDPLAPRRMLSPNEKYAALVAAAGYLPLTLSGEDYLELLPVVVCQERNHEECDRVLPKVRGHVSDPQPS